MNDFGSIAILFVIRPIGVNEMLAHKLVPDVRANLFATQIESRSSTELETILEAAENKHSEFWEMRLELIREELAARIAYQL